MSTKISPGIGARQWRISSGPVAVVKALVLKMFSVSPCRSWTRRVRCVGFLKHVTRKLDKLKLPQNSSAMVSFFIVYPSMVATSNSRFFCVINWSMRQPRHQQSSTNSITEFRYCPISRMKRTVLFNYWNCAVIELDLRQIKCFSQSIYLILVMAEDQCDWNSAFLFPTLFTWFTVPITRVMYRSTVTCL